MLNYKPLLRLASALPKGDENRRILLAKLKIALRLRQMEKMMSLGEAFGILSAYGPGSKSQNVDKNTLLVQELQKRNYRRFYPLKGSWEGVAEKSVLVPGIKFSDLVELGRIFDQVSVIYKHPSGVLGMYYLREGKAEFAVKDEGAMSADFQANPDLYSKARGISFEFGFLWGQKVPWNGQDPYSRKGLEKLLATGTVQP